MLKPDDALRELGKFQSEKHRQARFQRLKKLPKSAAAAGMGMFGVRPDGKPVREWQLRMPLEDQSRRAVAADATLRRKVLSALYPTFVKEIELGIGALSRLPYPVGQLRRPFRAPGRPELALALGGQYLDAVNNALAEVADDALTPEWVAAWTVHLHFDVARLGYLFAGLIDAGNDDVLEILKDSAANRHPIGGPGSHAIRGLLCCQRPEAWEFVANLLLAAQRQEGLRQSILETVDESHPEAFRRLLDIVLDQNLIRFAATARAASVWLGEEMMVEDAKRLKAALAEARELLGDKASRARALRNGNAESLYRALWSLAHVDVADAVAATKPILKEKNAGRRLAAIKLLSESQLPEAADRLVPLLQETDPVILGATLQFFTSTVGNPYPETAISIPDRLFEALEKTLDRLPEKPSPVKSPVASWPLAEISKQTAADLLPRCLGKRPAERLLPYLEVMSPGGRVYSLAHLCLPRTLTTRIRQTLLACAMEPSGQVRETALAHLKRCKLAEDEAQTLEIGLTRKNPDFRRGVFELLLNRSDKAVLASIDRLLPGDPLQRAAGIELGRRMSEAERDPESVNRTLARFLESKGERLPAPDREAIDRILHPPEKPPTLDDGLGLFDPRERSPVVAPKKQKVEVVSPAAVELLTTLDNLVHEHRDKTFVHVWQHGHSEEQVLGSIQWSHSFPSPDPNKSPEENQKNWPLREIWQEWLRNRPAETRDADGRELLRAAMLERVHVRDGETDLTYDPDEIEDRQLRQSFKQLHPVPPVRLRYKPVIDNLLEWFLYFDRPAQSLDFALDVIEQCLASVPQSLLERLPTSTQPVDAGLDDDDSGGEWRNESEYDTSPSAIFMRGFEMFEHLARHETPSPARIQRHYRLRRWLDEPRPGVHRRRVDLKELLAAYDAGAATMADFIDHLIGPRFPGRYSWHATFESLRSVTDEDRNKNYPLIDERPELRDAIRRVLDRIVEIELRRGETETAASAAVRQINSYPGLGPLFPLIAALGKNGFAKSSYRSGNNRPDVLTHLVQVMSPGEADTPAAFRKALEPWLESGKIGLDRIVELGLANPRLIAHVAAVTGWPGYEEAAYWFMAHSNCDWSFKLSYGGSHDGSLEKAWRQIVQERSNLSAEQRADGVIDVDWFHKAYAALNDDDRWHAIEKAARFLGYGHAEKKAARLADVLLGRTKKKDLVENIRKKYLKESVRLLGLLPLPADAKKREAELSDRYSVLKEYERYARGLSALSKEPAMQSYRLGMENLAVTAGYSDPVRLEWAVTGREVADLAKGPATVKVKDVAVTLRLGEFAEPEIAQSRGKEELKSIPKELKAHKAVEDLLERKKSLKRLAGNTKRTLELAMCAGDEFAAAELKDLMAHAIVRPMLERLALKSEGRIGFPVSGGGALQLPGGKSVPIGAKAQWSIAHPLDFVAARNWHEFQADCFRTERIQPFKQVFREVYTLTPAEKVDQNRSRRYSGQQVNENQAKALLSGRGWSTREELTRLYRAQDLIVDLALDHGYSTPGDAAAPAVGEVRFLKRGDWNRLPLDQVPAVIFSEVMRDLDLVVSVAHVGGVDPEATQSTVAMRSSLLSETCSLLRLENVKLESKHALIRGNYGQYSVHLGSGVVHKQPGGSLCVVAVNAQHRGRLFLPFADDDPRTAEVVSKVLLLARDHEIQDPTILQQIVSR